MHARTDQPEPDPTPGEIDPGGLKDAHGRTGRMLKNAGLPFEDDEFDDDGDETSNSSDSSSDSEEPEAPTSAPAQS